MLRPCPPSIYRDFANGTTSKSNLKMGYYQPIYILKMRTIFHTVLCVCVCSSISAYVYYMYISLKCIQKHAVLCQGCSSQISWRYSTLPLRNPLKSPAWHAFPAWHGLPKQLSSASFVAFNASRRNSSRLPQWRKATLRNLKSSSNEAKAEGRRGGATLRTPKKSSTASLIPESYDGWKIRQYGCLLGYITYFSGTFPVKLPGSRWARSFKRSERRTLFGT